jgi:hypothetical protein
MKKVKVIASQSGARVELEFSSKSGRFETAVGTAVEDLLTWHRTMRASGLKGFTAKEVVHFEIKRDGMTILSTEELCQIDAVRQTYVGMKLVDSPIGRAKFRQRMRNTLEYAFSDVVEGTLSDFINKGMAEVAQYKADKAKAQMVKA